MDEPKQHAPALSILLHLLPGALNLGLIVAFSHPAIAGALGVDRRLGPVVGYLLSILLGLLPIQLGVLLLAGRLESGEPGLQGVIRFTSKSRARDYLVFVPLLLLYFMAMFVLVAPLIQPWIVRTFFAWWPERYNFQLLLQDPSALAGHDGIGWVIVAYLLLSCILGPLVEEFYFRGYLLPRMDRYAGRWAPLLHTLLFSVYHFFSPWENLVRIVVSYPLVYLVWKKKDIRFGILVHILVNTIGGIIALVAIAGA